jgi:hypothetical protein
MTIKNQRSYAGFKTVSCRLSDGQYFDLGEYCKRKGNVSTASVIKDLIVREILEKKDKNFIAGVNDIRYDNVKGNFSWNLILDSDRDDVFIGNVGKDFLVDLRKKIDHVLQIEEENIAKQKKKSVAIPGKLLEGKK